MDLKYANACKEVLVLFDYFLDEEDLSKIPEKQIEYLKKNANQQYNYGVDESKELEEQNITKEAKAIIISLYKKYFTTNEQKKNIDEILTILDKQKNVKKISNTGFNSLEEALNHTNETKRVDKDMSSENTNVESNEKALVKSESMWRKILNKILKIFNLKK